MSLARPPPKKLPFCCMRDACRFLKGFQHSLFFFISGVSSGMLLTGLATESHQSRRLWNRRHVSLSVLAQRYFSFFYPSFRLFSFHAIRLGRTIENRGRLSFVQLTGVVAGDNNNKNSALFSIRTDVCRRQVSLPLIVCEKKTERSGRKQQSANVSDGGPE